MNNIFKSKCTILVVTVLLCICLGPVTAQDPPENISISLTSDKDSYILSNLPTKNYGTEDRIHAMSWTDHEEQVNARSLIYFDLSGIPEYSNIVSASISLYGVGHNIVDPNNLKLNVVTGSWEETSVNWLNQPTTTTQDEVIIETRSGKSTGSELDSETENYTIDLSTIVQKWVNSNYENLGLLLSLETEEGHTDFVFGSKEFATEGYQPQLDIIYSEQSYSDLEIFPTKDAVVMSSSRYENNNYGNDPYFRSYSWPDRTEGQIVARSLIKFEFSTIPPNSTIHRATISLYAIRHYDSYNASYLRRITEEWQEDMVTWTTQPTYDATESPFLESSTTMVQNYEVDITDIVQSWVNGDFENYGLLLMLENETQMASLMFGSSDHSDSGKNPKVSITFTPKDFELNTCYYDQAINWSYTAFFNGNAYQPYSQIINYYNFLGHEQQSQTKLYNANLVEELIIASHKIYDALDRPVIKTLPAPLVGDFCFNSDFILTTRNEPLYSYLDFDTDENIYSPIAVTNTDCPLGIYYSENDIYENYVASDQWPYLRTEYSNLNPNAVRRSTIAGEHYKLGSGHEAETYSMVTNINEVNGYNSVTGHLDYNNYDQIIKKIEVDQDNKENVSFYDKEGNILASCLSGYIDGLSVSPINVNIEFPEQVSTPFIDFHLTNGVDEFTINDIPGNTDLILYDLSNDELIWTQYSGSGITSQQYTQHSGYYRLQLTGTLQENSTAKIGFEAYYYDHSFYYYDKAGRLLKLIPPEGVDNINLHTTNSYNALGWLIRSNSPDEGTTDYVYKKDGKIRFSRNAKQVVENKFSYINYDILGRIVEVGEFETSTQDPLFFETYEEYELSLDPNSIHIILEEIYTGPWEQNGRSQQIFTWYDTPVEGFETKLIENGLSTIEYEQNFLHGNVSGTKNSSSTTWYSYDELGRVEWVIQEIAGLEGLNTIDYEYHFNGDVKQVTFQKHKSDERFDHIYTYDVNQRLTEVYTDLPIKGDPAIKQAFYHYYTHGPLKRVELAFADDEPLQGIDYVYTINGWLKTINHPELANLKPEPFETIPLDPGGDNNDVFGIAYDYFFGDYKRQNTYINYGMINPDYNEVNDIFSGNIRSIRWNINDNTLSTNIYDNTKQWAYHYDYDHRNWIKGAVFGRYTQNNEINWHQITTIPSNENFTPDISDQYLVSNISYDANGNIKSLYRNGYSGAQVRMDELSYNYDSNLENRLLSISDDVNDPHSVYENDIENQASDNYLYDEIGQMIRDQSMGQYSYIKYDVSGKVHGIYENSNYTNPLVEYHYNELGYRIKKVDYYRGVSVFYIRDIAGNIICIYEGDIKEYPIYGTSRVGTLLSNGVDYFSYNYELSDHLGNVRAVVSRDINNELVVNSFSDYYPFGWPMPGHLYTGADPYRYGYQGQYAEKDEEGEWNAFELRLWDSRTCRWQTIDPVKQYHSNYLGMGNNPINGVDSDGSVFGEWDIINGIKMPVSGLGGDQTDYFNYLSGNLAGMTMTFNIASLEYSWDKTPSYLGKVFSKGYLQGWQHSFSKTLTIYDIPFYGSSAASMNAFAHGDYLNGTTNFLWCGFEVIGLGYGTGYNQIFKTAAKSSTRFTKSNLKLGQQMHKAYKANLHNPAKGLYKEFTGIKGIRPDFVNFNKRIIYELKPNNPRQIQAGWKQLNHYKFLFEQQYGGKWKTILDLY